MLKLAWDAFKDARNGRELDVSTSASAHGDFASGAFLSLGNPMNIVFWTGLGTTVFASITGKPQPIHFAIFFAGFLAARSCGASSWQGWWHGETMDDTKLFPLGQSDLWH